MAARDALAGLAKVEIPSGDDAPLLPDADLMTAATLVAEARRFLDATEAHLLAELDRRASTEDADGLQTATWWSRLTGRSLGEGRRRVATARALGDVLPTIDEAVSRGELDWERAQVVADALNERIEADLALVQPHLLDLSRGASYARFARDVDDLARGIDADGGYRPERDPYSSKLHLARLADGSVRLRGELHGDQAHTVATVLDDLTDEMWRRHGRDRQRFDELPRLTRGQLRAQALAELCRRGAAVDLATSRPPRTEASLVIGAGPPVDLPSAVRVQDGTTRLLVCDPALRAVVVDSLGTPLDLGRQVRRFTPAQRTAIEVRDGGCVFPGCDLPVRWCDSHHDVDWEHGGLTDVRRGRLLCRRHHRLFHGGGWQLVLTPGDDWPIVVSPTGRRSWSQRHGRIRAGPAP